MSVEPVERPDEGVGALTDQVLASFDDTADPRLRTVMQAVVRHAHQLVQELGLTDAEWLQAIRFLTDVGRATDADRQEFILLSDVLGISSLVVDQAHPDAEDATAAALLGPFYVPGSPRRRLGETIAVQDPGDRVLVRGTVRSTSGRPLAGAVVDVWQSSTTRLYDVQDPTQPEGNLRGRFETGADGRFWFTTVRPTSYAIPDDGPVGRLLARTGRHPWRAAHIHFIVSAPDHEAVTTQLYDADNLYLGTDAVFGVKESLVRELVVVHEGDHGWTPEGPHRGFVADFVLVPSERAYPAGVGH